MNRLKLTRDFLLFNWFLVSLIIIIGEACFPPASHAEGAGEYQVKAAFLYHFATFVDWPSSTFKSTNGQLRVCIMGKDPFGQILEKTLGEKTIQSHALAIHRNPPKNELQHCHLLYLTGQQSPTLKTFHQQFPNADVLTVGESSEFIQLGGMVQFFLENQKVRFAINPDAVNQTNLKISSKLLRLAKITSP